MDVNRIVFIGGKGGVGKSTTAAALALKTAQAGKRTLLVSTDPAHNLGDIFAVKLQDKKRKVRNKLYAIEIDPASERDKYIAKVKENLRGIVQATMVEEVNRQLDTASASPGADEAALFDRLISIMIEESEEFEQLIFDTAPTGHTVRLLTLPDLMGVWIEGLLAKRKQTRKNYAALLHDGELVDDPIFDLLQTRQKRFKHVRDLLLNEQVTSFIFVLNPEKLSITETEAAVSLLSKYGFSITSLLVNRLLPDEDQGSFFLKRKEQEKTYLEEIERKFRHKKLIYIPFFAHDMTDLAHLEKFASYLRKE